MILLTNKLPRETPFDVYFSDRKPYTTMKQMGYLWRVVYKTLSDALGYSLEEMHEICKVKHALRTEFSLMNHGVVEITLSTKMMDTRQMTEYIDKIRHWSMNELGIHIPQPNEITDEHFIESKGYV